METEATILITDDQPELLESISLALESAGYQALTATDGLEALELLRSESVDLILADIAMPGMNGYQLYERIQENPTWLVIPFIFLTARSFDSDIRYGKELGVDDYLIKPIKPEDLLAVVRGKLHRARQLSQVAAQSGPALGVSDILSMGPLQINVGQHRAYWQEQELKLSAKEFVLLQYLAQHAGQVISPPELVKATHQIEVNHVDAGSLLGPLLHALRRKLELVTGKTELIENVRGVGYRLLEPQS